MRLSDVMSQMGLSSYAEVALLLFLFAFLLIALKVFFGSAEEFEQAAAIPLDDYQVKTPRNQAKRQG